MQFLKVRKGFPQIVIVRARSFLPMSYSLQVMKRELGGLPRVIQAWIEKGTWSSMPQRGVQENTQNGIAR